MRNLKNKKYTNETLTEYQQISKNGIIKLIYVRNTSYFELIFDYQNPI